ncbi:rubredoxin [Candidatus Methanoperedens nitratireducens]|uniref:rubredoxin n=1 Tax=Candidatus Methanoperedens nitratireducens TaxID=1392998 RepID=UPI000BB6E78C|nr:rubredoxin [Candidatus Methanoperedens nitroreducens]
MAKYQCSICNYIYDTDKGEPPEIKPGTAFEDIPDDWICPSCRVCGKDMFKKI